MGCSTLILPRMTDLSVYHSTVAALSDRCHSNSKREPNHSCIPLSNNVFKGLIAAHHQLPGRMSNLFVAAWSLVFWLNVHLAAVMPLSPKNGFPRKGQKTPVDLQDMWSSRLQRRR